MDVCGSATDDIVNSESNVGKVSINVGGVGRNIAENIGRLGVNCSLLSVVGDDAFGQMIMRQTEASGVDVSHIYEAKGQPTSVYQSILDPYGELTVAINDMAASELITPDYINSHDSKINDANLIVLDANIPLDTLEFIAQKYGDKQIIADGVSVRKVLKLRSIFSSINCLKVNLNEARALCGSLSAGPVTLASSLREQEIDEVYITLGAEGVYFDAQEECGTVNQKSNAANIINVTGAGDAFCAGLAVGFVEKWQARDSAQFANAAAVLTAGCRDTVNIGISRAMVKRLLE